MTTLFIGGGNMASALIGGLLARGRTAGSLAVVEPVEAQRDRLAARFPGVALHAAVGADAVRGATLVVLAVKPQQMRDACMALAPFVAPGNPPGPSAARATGAAAAARVATSVATTVGCVLSIAAGTRSADIAQWLGGFDRVVRAMPNTPAMVGKGIAGVHAQPAVDPAQRDAAAAVLEAGGEVVWVDSEAMLDAVTGVSGSGPAYVFYFLEALETAARAQGFAPADARRLAYATFDGAVALAKASAEEPATLRAQVTSKGGTTERGVAALDAAGVRAAVVAAVTAATARAAELGAGN
jgi:pyrroline-5-carboxylate reductase